MKIIAKQAGVELSQAQIKLKLGCTSIRICFIQLMIAKCYQPLHISEHDYPVLGTTHLIIHHPLQPQPKLPEITFLTDHLWSISS